jgi:uncharacterized protein YgiB involved in biofilm formation
MTEETLAPTTTLRRLKRSRGLQVTSLMATVGFSVSACGVPQAAPPPPEPALAYTSVAECRTADVIPDAECDAAYAAAQAKAAETSPRYATREECEGQWGPNQCEPRNQGGGSFFGPLATGFIIGQLLNGGGYRGGGPLYRDRDGHYSNGYGGGYLGRDYRTGRSITNAREHTDVARQAPPRAQSRTAVVSRGGFGGGGRGFGG